MQFQKGDHVVAIWFVPGDGVDWMGTLVRRGELALVEYRWRYHASDGGQDPFSDNDRKSFYAGSGPAAEIHKYEAALDTAAYVCSLRYGNPVDKVRIDGDIDAFITALAKKPWAHIQRALKVPEPTGPGGAA